MKYELFIAIRYLRARRKQTMISVITGISIFGVALGVAALIIVLAVMTGFEEDLRTKILGTNSHIVMSPRDTSETISGISEIVQTAASVDGVIGAQPFLFLKAMISRQEHTDGILIKAIDPDSAALGDLAKNVIRGSLQNLRSSNRTALREQDPDLPQNAIVLGVELAAAIGVSLNQVVNVTSTATTLTPMGMVPKSRAFQVVGLVSSGMYEYDRTMGYISMDSARDINGGRDVIDGIEIRVADIFRTESIIKKLRGLFRDRFWIRDWKEMNHAFFSALKLEKIAMFIILTLIVFVAAFNIISSLTLMVMEKNKDIGILKTMGATHASIQRIFLTQGMIIGSVGTLIGCVAGVVLSLLADRYQWIRLEGEVYYISHLPFLIDLNDVFAICTASLIISLLATIYPARQAAKLDPVEAIRYE